MSRVALFGSERAPVEARVVGPPDKSKIQVSIVLEDGAKLEDIDSFLDAYDLAFADRIGPVVKVVGKPVDMERAFETQLDLVDHPELGRFRRRSGGLTAPTKVAGSIFAVLGLDDRPVARPHYQYHQDQYVGEYDGEKMVKELAPFAAAPAGSFTPPQLAQLYGLPSSDGKGVTIGILELGGASNPKDISAAARLYGVTIGNVTIVSVDGAKPKSDGPNGADGEVALDVQVVGGIAPSATQRVYFAPNTTAGFLDALVQALAECDVVSISWGGPEDSWTAAARASFEKVMQASPVPVFVASGDQGSSDGEGGTKSHVDFPASSPSAIGCGGTYLTATPGAFGTIAVESVWNRSKTSAGGGGVSTAFAVPDYQAPNPDHGTPSIVNVDTKKTGRVVPDVAGCADPQSGIQVVVDGDSYVIGGTSAVAPLWAAVAARLKSLGADPSSFHHKLYAAGQQRDVTTGSNGAYKAGPGFDACTGLGSPDGAKLGSIFLTAVPVDPPDPPPVDPGPPALTAEAVDAALEKASASVDAAVGKVADQMDAMIKTLDDAFEASIAQVKKDLGIT